jgi:hypothetical protein
MNRKKADKGVRGMERSGPDMQEWVAVGVDDDGTQAYLDAGSIVRDIEPATLFKVCVMHVPPEGSRTYAELIEIVKAAKKNSSKPGHVKQVIEIDFAKDAFRDQHLIVCDKQGAVLNVINFRYPDWTNIERGSIIDKVRDDLFRRFPDATGGHAEPLKFSPSRAHLKPDRIEVSNRYRIDAEPSKPAGLPLTMSELSWAALLHRIDKGKISETGRCTLP